MKRIDKIYNYISDNSKKFTKKDLLNLKGFTTMQISSSLGILRNNVSKELNILCKEKKVVKIKNRPVFYFHRKIFEDLLSIKLPKEVDMISDINLLIKNSDNTSDDKYPFKYLIGAETSLKNQVEQAKAAIMYPPNGLNTLVIGSTGVGKSLFVKIMYEYAKYMNMICEDAPFVVFNCADYANNPQLLLSHLFGHVKGAFTGADKETDGVIAKADKGILFLDEIHRLPPEGQEMIFYFMDTGTYNKLGENERRHKANVLLIGATTEDPASSLLNTFIRRIPMTIRIPDFKERTLEDQVGLLEFLIENEAKRIKKSIRISQDSIKALIGSTSYGNVGQLKSNVQLVCAKGFLDSIKTNEIIDITLDVLPENIKSGIVTFLDNNKEDYLCEMIPQSIIITPDKNRVSIKGNSKDISLEKNSKEECVGIVVAAYGTCTAASMVNEVKRFLNADNIAAVDISLGDERYSITQKVINKVREVNRGAGVLLLVDMPSLKTIKDTIINNTNIKIKIIDMVSMPIVLEAVKKCTNSDLDYIYSYLLDYLKTCINKIDESARFDCKSKYKKEELKDIIESNGLDNDNSDITLKLIFMQSLNESINYVNLHKVYPLLERFVESLGNYLNIKYKTTSKLKIMIHTAYALERMVLKDGLIYKLPDNTINKMYFEALKKASSIFEESMSIKLTDDELCYMIDVISS